VRSTHLVWPNYHYKLRIVVRNKGGGETPPAVLKYEVKPLANAKGQTFRGSCEVPALRGGDSRTIASESLPYAMKGRFEVKVWLELPPGTQDPDANNVVTERYTF